MDYYNNDNNSNNNSNNNGSAQDDSMSDTNSNNEFARVNRVMLPKSSEEYRQKRERNNAAVKRSRHKSKQKTLETQKRVDQLKDENSQLERRVESLNRELNFMRAIFVPRRDPQQIQLQQQQQQQQQHQFLQHQPLQQEQAIPPQQHLFDPTTNFPRIQ